MSVVCFSLRQGEAFKEHLLKEEHEPHALKGLVLHLKLKQLDELILSI